MSELCTVLYIPHAKCYYNLPLWRLVACGSSDPCVARTYSLSCPDQDQRKNDEDDPIPDKHNTNMGLGLCSWHGQHISPSYEQ